MYTGTVPVMSTHQCHTLSLPCLFVTVMCSVTVMYTVPVMCTPGHTLSLTCLLVTVMCSVTVMYTVPVMCTHQCYTLSLPCLLVTVMCSVTVTHIVTVMCTVTRTSTAVQLPLTQQATSGEDFVATQGSVTLGAASRQASVGIVIKQVSIFQCFMCGGWNSSLSSVLTSLPCVMLSRGFEPPLSLP